MDRWSRSLSVGAGLLVVFGLGMLILAVAWHIDRAYRHVEVEVHNVNDVGRVSVNCQRALTVFADDGPQTIDLGYLDPDDRIALSAFNEIGDATWGFRVISNGETVFERKRGVAQAAGFAAEEYAVVMAKSITADGDMLGTIGCDPPLVVSPELVDYTKSADLLLGRKSRERDSWQPSLFPYASFAWLSGWVLPLLTLIGCAVALTTPEARTLVRRHWKISAAIGLVGLLLNLWRQFGLDGMVLFAELSGIAFLLFAAAVHIWVGLVLGGVVGPPGFPMRNK